MVETGIRFKHCTRIKHSVEGKCGVEVWRQVGSVHFPRNNRSVVWVEGAVRGYRVTTRDRGLGWDAVPLCRGHGTLPFMSS